MPPLQSGIGRFARLIAITLCCILSFSLMVIVTDAQDTVRTYSFPDSTASVAYPEPWTLTANDDGSVTLSDGSIIIDLYDSAFISRYLKFDDSSTPVVVLLTVGDALKPNSLTPFEQERLVEQPVGERLISTYLYIPEASNVIGLFAVVPFSDGTYGFADAQIPLSAIEQGQQTVLSLLETFDTAPAENVPTATPVETISTEPCTVSTDRAAVSVRVGPGSNRGIFTSMPTSQDITVLGQATIGEAIWWKLDKDQIQNSRDARQLWVAAADVNESSDACNQVEVVIGPTVLAVASPVPGATTDPQLPPPPPGVTPSPTSPFNMLCPGSTSTDFIIVAWGSTDIGVVSACLANLRYWEGFARSQQAARQASGLCDAQPTADEFTSYFATNWALADVATGYFILGLRYEAAGQSGAAQNAFSTVINSYSCAWAWDPQGWFWSLAKAAWEHM